MGVDLYVAGWVDDVGIEEAQLPFVNRLLSVVGDGDVYVWG